MCVFLEKLFKRENNKMGLKNESYYNNKWKQKPIIYNGRALRGKKDRIGVDVKDFIPTNDNILGDIVNRYRLNKGRPDLTAHAVQKWVVKFLSYKYDEDENQCPEFWQFPFESIASKVGDCEDGAILTASLMIAAGIPNWRCKVAAGYVQSSPTAPQGGHSYALYLADDGDWRIMDWCYYEDSRLTVAQKPLAKNGGYKNCYKAVWFTFNNEYSWNQTSLTIGGRMANDRGDDSSNTLQEVVSDEISLESIMEDVDKKVGKFEE